MCGNIFTASCLQDSSMARAQDDDPYVRKTAAVCVAKLYDINPELVEDRGFLDALKVTPCHCWQQETSVHAQSRDTCIKFMLIHAWKCLVHALRGSVREDTSMHVCPVQDSPLCRSNSQSSSSACAGPEMSCPTLPCMYKVLSRYSDAEAIADEQQRMRRTGSVLSATAMHVSSAKSPLCRSSCRRAAARAQDRTCPVGHGHACIQYRVTHLQRQLKTSSSACAEPEVSCRLLPCMYPVRSRYSVAEAVHRRAAARAQDLLADSNPMVVANAVAALAEIHEVGGSAAFHITSTSLFKLLRALNECTEWGQARRQPSMSASSWPPLKKEEACKVAQEQPAQVLVCLNGPLHRHAGQSYIVWQTRG